MCNIRYKYMIHAKNMTSSQIMETTRIIRIYLNIHNYENIIFYQKGCFEINVYHKHLTRHEDMKVKRVIIDAIEGGVMTC